MPAKTIQLTIELPVETIVAFGQLWQKQGNEIGELHPARLIETSINSLVPWFIQKNWITKDENPDLIYEEMFGEPPFPADDETPPMLADTFKAGEEVESRVQAKLREKELEGTHRSTEPKEVADVAKPGKVNLLMVNRMDIDTLSKLAPKDTLIEKIVKGIADPVYRAAVEIVYTSLSPDLWGTATAEQAVNDMVQRHEVAK